jgi:hypothetical protein
LAVKMSRVYRYHFPPKYECRKLSRASFAT